jgi:hypothetical protein
MFDEVIDAAALVELNAEIVSGVDVELVFAHVFDRFFHGIPRSLHSRRHKLMPSPVKRGARFPPPPNYH